ncbi:hypothetical protein T484DRAFT_1755699 [Baffinella frigidus]|nr:hypothetical protein T484DRAFT_1755699 [Cryptophyta sp. CCMP2293]
MTRHVYKSLISPGFDRSGQGFLIVLVEHKTNHMVQHAPSRTEFTTKTATASHGAMEYCGVEDEESLINNCRPTSAPLALGSLSVALFAARSRSTGLPSPSSARSASPTKAVLEWEAGRERRASIASDPRRSSVISAYFEEELLSFAAANIPVGQLAAQD